MAYNFEGNDDELLVAGCNAKAYPHAAISRHGNFVQWGFGEPPSKMTEDGRRVFVNCLCYIRQFAGRPPVVRRQAMSRRCALPYKAISEDLLKKYKGRADELYQFHKDKVGLLRYEEKPVHDGWLSITFPIDSELKALGIASNRRVRTLEQLVALLAPEAGPSESRAGFLARWRARREQKDRATKALVLLRRYTGLDFTTPEQWRQWLEQNRRRLFFSDFGGYRFYVAPEGYPGVPAAEPTDEPFRFPR